MKLHAQIRVGAAICVLHNILVDLDEEGMLFTTDDEYDEEETQSHEADSLQAYNISRIETLRANTRRHRIATEMWASYEARQQRCPRLGL